MRLPRFLVPLLLLLGASLQAATVNLIQNSVNDATSTPVAITAVSSNQFLESGASYSTLTAPATVTISSVTYRFTHWTVSTTPSASYRDPWGRSLNPISFTLLEDTTATAHYLPEKNGTAIRDTDSDGIPDWYELEYYGSLTNAASHDSDGDGITLLAEYTAGTHPLFPNATLEGGVTFVDSALVTCNLAGYPSYSLSSIKNGAADTTVPATTTIALPGTVITTTDLSANTAFGYWTLDGVRQADPWGVAYPKISFTTGPAGSPNRVVIAYLFTGDTDSDGIPDAYEQYYFGTLGNGATSDPDQDGVGILAERTAGTNPLYGNSVLEGGVTWVDSLLQTVNLAGYSRYILTSVPAGTVNESNVVPTGTVVTTPSLSQATFGHWTLDGTRQADAWGTALRQLSFTVQNTDRNAVATFFTGDSDSDGIADAVEIYYFGTLAFDANSDSDNDGFTLLQEIAAGTHPLYGNASLLGGVTWVDTALLTANLQGFEKLSLISLNGTLTNFFSPDPAVVSGISVGSSASAAFTDWDGDGDLDLFVAGENALRFFQNTGTAQSMALQEITSGFEPLAALVAGITRPVLAGGDWNGDGKGDLVVGGDNGSLLLFASTGTLSGSADRIEFPIGSTKARPALGDMNGDGKPDLLVLLADGSVTVWLNSGTPPYFSGTGTPNFLGATVANALSLAVGDINQDDIPDLLVSDTAGQISEFVRSSASGSFVLKSKTWGGTAPGFASGLILTSVDLEGDGDLDAVGGLSNGGLVALRDPQTGRPSGVTAVSGADSIQLSWNPNSESRIRGYYVYRSSGSGFERVDSNLTLLPKFIDKTAVPGIENQYYVTGISYFYTPGNSRPRIVQSLPSDSKGEIPGKLRLFLRPAYGTPGGLIKIQISMELSTSVSGQDLFLRIGYDPATLRPWTQARPGQPTVLQTGLTKHVAFTDNGSSATGELTIAGNDGAMRPGEGKIFELQFEVAPNVPPKSFLAVSLLETVFKDLAARPLATEIMPQDPPEAVSAFLLGDFDGNGVLNNNDFVLLMSVIKTKTRKPTPSELRAGDLNGDGRLNQNDQTLLFRLLQGKSLEVTP
jgi:hypothetical protein